MNIFILGPTSSGKTNLAFFIARQFDLPIFNCDAIQIYKNLNKLTNKPQFNSQIVLNGETLSIVDSNTINQNLSLENIEIQLITKNKTNFDINWEQLIDLIKNFNPQTKTSDQIKNYLFDIRYPGETYSVKEFTDDFYRIKNKFKFTNTLIVGGTIYYAYHLLFNTEFEPDSSNAEMIDVELDIAMKVVESFISKHKIILNIKNPRRLIKYYKLIKKYGDKFVEVYYKKQNLGNDDYFVILLLPKNRTIYYQKLDEVVDKRFCDETFYEIEYLLKSNVSKDWLEKLSYEYKYFLKIYKVLKNENTNKQIVDSLLQELKYKEHQYAKRQITWIRKLKKDILSFNNTTTNNLITRHKTSYLSG
ncbi:MAG: hypothetical protein N3A71_01835 [Candidatus Dojkabacteria bacterium]|nr:hypothetical protein [Candidatus Dojkabacteria bacterium]